MRDTQKTFLTAALIVVAAIGVSLIGGARPSEAQVGANEIMIIPVGNGAAAWVHTPRDGVEYCYIDGNSMRCIRR